MFCYGVICIFQYNAINATTYMTFLCFNWKTERTELFFWTYNITTETALH